MSNFNLIFQSLRGLYDLPAAPPANDRFLVWSDTGTMSAITFAKLREHILNTLPNIDTEATADTIVQRDAAGGVKAAVLEIEASGVSNVTSLNFTNLGAGNTGMRFGRSSGGAVASLMSNQGSRWTNSFTNSGGLMQSALGSGLIAPDRGLFQFNADANASGSAPYLFGLKHGAPDAQFARFTNSDGEDVWQVHAGGRTTGADAVDDKDFVTLGQAEAGFVTATGDQVGITGDKSWEGKQSFRDDIEVFSGGTAAPIRIGRARDDVGSNRLSIAIGNMGALSGSLGPITIGSDAAQNSISAIGAVILGYQAAVEGNNQYTTILGVRAARNNTASKVGSVVIGSYALEDGSGGNSVIIGNRAARTLNAASNVIVGADASQGKTSGAFNTIIGTRAGLTDISDNADIGGDYNTWIGAESGPGVSSNVRFSTAVGYRAKTGAVSATSIGREALALGNVSTSIGYMSSATGNNSVAIGASSVASRAYVVSVGNSTGEGTQIQRQITDVAAGTQATDAVNLAQMETAVTGAGEAVKSEVVNLTDNQTDIDGDKSWIGNHTFADTVSVGSSLTVDGISIDRRDTSSSLRIGIRALDHPDMASVSNTAIGTNALQYHASGAYNTAVGTNALRHSAGGNFKTAVGDRAGEAGMGIDSVAIGSTALQNATSSNNTVVGSRAASLLTTGSGNVLFGNHAGNAVSAIGTTALTEDGGNTFVGTNVGKLTENQVSNSVILGYRATTGVSNSVTLGALSTNDRADTVSVGNDTTKRQITNVAAGIEPHDAVNLQQLQSAVASSSLSDGSYGDVTVSNNASVWAINPNAVTLDKISNNAVSNAKLAAMPTQTFKGRFSTGAGSPENLTVAQVQSMLGLATTYQPLNGNLSAISNVILAANQGLYTTSSDVMATYPLTAFGRTLTGRANAAAARSTLELGTMATQAANNVSITGGSISGIIIDGGSY